MLPGNPITSEGATSIIASRLEMANNGTKFEVAQIYIDASLNASDPRIASLPVEVRNGPFMQALKYVEDLVAGSFATFKNKVMFVGMQAVGKTSLNYALIGDLSGTFTKTKAVFGTHEYQILVRGPNLVISSGNGKMKRILLSGDYHCEQSGTSLILHNLNHKQTSIKKYKYADRLVLVMSDVDIHHLQIEFVNIEIEFQDAAMCGKWAAHICNWTDNHPTEGIETIFKDVTQEKYADPLQLCFMDFAGQGEFVTFCFY